MSGEALALGVPCVASGIAANEELLGGGVGVLAPPEDGAAIGRLAAALLPQPYETLTHFNPIYYMINLVRYGFVGYTEVSIALSLLALTAATAALFLVNLRLFSKGYRLRA